MFILAVFTLSLSRPRSSLSPSCRCLLCLHLKMDHCQWFCCVKIWPCLDHAPVSFSLPEWPSWSNKGASFSVCLPIPIHIALLVYRLWRVSIRFKNVFNGSEILADTLLCSTFKEKIFSLINDKFWEKIDSQFVTFWMSMNVFLLPWYVIERVLIFSWFYFFIYYYYFLHRD